MDYNPLLPEVQLNPYPYYTELRRHAPVYWVESLQCWAVSRYDDVQFVVKNPQLFSSAIMVQLFLAEMDPVPETHWMIALDPPTHTRQRSLVSKAFSPRTVAELEPRIRAVTEQMLDRVIARGEFELVRDLSGPLPVIVIAELLGVEAERREDLKRWSDDVVSGSNRSFTPEDEKRVRQSIVDLRAYFEETIARRRKEPRTDLISALIRAEEENQTLTAIEILSSLIMLLLAGHETTTNLIGNMVVALLDHPEELAKVRADTTLIPQVVEETLRYEAPLQGMFRVTTQDVVVAGTTIPAGAAVMQLYGSANHDETKFPDPERFDINRETDRHLAFGFGIHFCIGAALGRLEAKIILETLLRRFRSLSPKGGLIRTSLPFLRGVKALPLLFEPA